MITAHNNGSMCDRGEIHLESMNLDKLFLELKYPEETEQMIRNERTYRKIKEISETAYSGEEFKFELCNRQPLTRLAVVTFLLLSKYGDYKEKGIPDHIIFDTFRDVSLRAGLYYRRTGRVGISKEDVIWFRHIMNVKIFKIGVLQFQPFEMIYLDEETIGEAYMRFQEEQKKSLPSKAPVINCHIQYGADLDPQAVERSFHKAWEFFQTYYPDIRFRAFLCGSWLLYPPMTEHLSSQSRIRQFAERFEIIGTYEDSGQAMENLFEEGKCRVLPRMTTLQKMAMDHKEWFGFACGIIRMNERQ